MSNYQKLIIGAIAPVFWGTTYVVVNLNLQEATPIWMAALRALPAGLLLLMIKPQGFPVGALKMWLLSFFNISCFFVLLFIAAYRLPGSIAGTLAALFPIFLMLLAWALYGVKPQAFALALSALGFIGVGLLLNPFGEAQSLDWIGILASFLAMLSFARCTLWMRDWKVKSMWGLTAWQLILGGLMLIPIAMIFEDTTPNINWSMTPGLIWMIVLNTSVSYAAFIYSTKQIETEVLGLLALLNPIIAVITGVLMANEMLSATQYLGIALVIAALIGVIKQQQIKQFFISKIKQGEQV